VSEQSVKRTIAVSIDQLYRDQPGGIGTYVRGLLHGLSQVGGSEIVGIAPRGDVPSGLQLSSVSKAALGVKLLTRAWPNFSLGVPKNASVVHATSMAGPFNGGLSAIHSVAMHDLLWRDEPSATTSAGIAFHEQRLELLARKKNIRIFTSSPGLKERLVVEGFDASRIVPIRLGVDDESVTPASSSEVGEMLSKLGVTGPFTFYAGTREPRKNLASLIAAHRRARETSPELGPLVISGSKGWGEVSTEDATVVGLVDWSLLKGLYRDCTVFAYVPRAEGWGLSPIEALNAGARVVASSTTPSVNTNENVVLVDPRSEESIADGLVRALELPLHDEKRKMSVSEFTWKNCALDHLAGWA
jgi:glycosyltransferase involved in cell wall biosynthesis